MASLTIKLLVDGPHVINDLGMTIEGVAGDSYSLSAELASDIANSTDMQTAVDAGAFVALDPRDPAGILELSAAESKLTLTSMNNINWGVVGGKFADLDDPNLVLTENTVVTIGPDGDAVAKPLTDLLALGDNTNNIEDIVGNLFAGEPDITYDGDAATLELEDNFLRNTGDTIDSGTISVTSGAAIDIESGGALTIQEDPINPTDAVNKRYADALANGMDHKASTRVATTADLGATFVAGGGTGGVGDTLSFTTPSGTVIDDITLEEGDRVLVKGQTDAKQNGIYVATNTDASEITILTRAQDQDGSASNEVTAGNTTFVEQGTQFGSTGWIVTGDGELEVNTDDIIWTQNSGMGTYIAAEGILLDGNQFSLITDNISVAVGSVEFADELIIGDASDSLSTAKTTVGNVLSDLNVVNGIDTDGFTVRTAKDTYVSRSFKVEPVGALGGLVVSNADGLNGDVTFGLDIQNAAARDVVTGTDLVLVFDASSGENRTYTITDIADHANSFKIWTATGNATGNSSIVQQLVVMMR